MVMHYAKPWEQPSAVAASIVILLLAWINCSTICTVASVSMNSVTWSGIICNLGTSLREFLYPGVIHFTGQTLLTINRKHFFMNILCIEFFCPQKRLTECCSSVEHSSSACRFDYWNQPMNMHIHVCYLDCHEAVLCCCLVMHIENLLRPLQLFHFYCDLLTNFSL
jgi:hypothetical protein